MNSHHHVDLIDTTEMYLRTIYELGEEGIPPLRARIAERLGQSGPTVSQTVARMERDGLVHVESDRQLALSEAGRRNARSVMRKHRLAECLLADVIGLEWDQLHIEACRWEHVMSEAVERRIVALLEGPLVCPHGNPIPALEELGVVGPVPVESSKTSDGSALSTLSASLSEDVTPVSIIRISEHLQADAGLMRLLVVAGVVPGHTVIVRRVEQGAEVFSSVPALGADGTVLPSEVADGIFVTVLSGSSHATGPDAEAMVIACSTANAGSLATERDAS